MALRGEGLYAASIEARLGTVEYRRDDLGSAEKHYQHSLAARDKLAPGSLDSARSHNNLGIVYMDRGMYTESEKHHKSALAIRERLAPGSLDLASTYNNLGVLARTLGHLETAKSYYQRDLEILQKLVPGTLVVADSFNNLGNLAWERSDLTGAEMYHQRALSIREGLGAHSLDIADSYHNLGLVARARGDLAAAEVYYQRALGIQEKLAPNRLAVGTTYNSLGITAKDRGDLDGAEAYHQKALAIWKELNPESLDVAISLNNLGVVSLEKGNLLAAEEYHLGSLAIRQRLLPNSRDAAYSLHNLGGVALARGDFDKAEAFLNESLNIRKRTSQGSLELAMTFNDMGNVAWARGDLRLAEKLYEEGLAIVEAVAPNSITEAQTLHALGEIFREGSEPQRAESFLSRGIDALEGQIHQLGGSYDIRDHFRARNKKIYLDHIGVLLELGRPAQAFHSLERYRARGLLELLAERDLVFSADISEELDNKRRHLALQYDQTLQQIKENPKYSGELSGELKSLLRERDELVARIRSESPNLASLQYPTVLTLAEVQETLEPGASLLSYSIGEKQLTVFLVAHDDFKVHALSIDREELTRIVNAFLANIERGRDPGSPFFRSLQSSGRRLYQILINPIEEDLETSERLIVVPDGVLHNLPLGALIRPVQNDDLRTARDWQYLVEWKPIDMVLSATLYAELQKKRTAVSRGKLPLVAAFGDASYGEIAKSRGDTPEISDVQLRAMVKHGIFKWESLPYTRQEVFQVARLHRNIQLFVGDAATEEQVKRIGRDIQTLHLATHGYLDDGLPLNSAVVLTIPDDLSENQENGLLQSWEIFESIRIDADLVVLSACQSAAGEEQGGEGLIGLTRAFQYAGARTVAASLWSVNDQSTAELMIRFYRHLRSGLSKDEALRAAQIQLIRGPIEVTDADGQKIRIDASAPYYWAAFQIYGDWQ